jgi:hypothetical protein
MLKATHDADENNFQPNIHLEFTQALLNQYLINVTLSALSLDTWTERKTITTAQYHNTYHFSSPLNLILPYALSLGAALIFVGIGTWSLLQNGASAADGGFLQIMKSTTGRTEMEELVIKDNAEGKFASQELLDLKVRYGELVDTDGVSTGRAAFGTEGETRPLRKDWNAV